MRRTATPWRVGALAVGALAALASAVPGPSRAAPSAPFLGGTWVNEADTASSFFVSQNYFRSALYISWGGLGAHAGLRGTFDGTLDGLGRAYNGTFRVTEGQTVVDGNGRVVISSINFHRFPLLRVKLEPNQGASSLITLEVLFPAVAPPPVGPAAPAKVGVNCDSASPCSGAVAADVAGSPGAVDPGGRPSASAAARRAVEVAYVPFRLRAGAGKVITVRLNRLGRSLLARSGSLKVRIVITMKASSGLPPRSTVGTVTFRRH